MDYRIYRYSRREILLYGMTGAALLCLAADAFYHSWLAVLPGIPLLFLFFKHYKKHCIRKRREELREQWKDMLYAFCAALSAGYGWERALMESEKSLGLLYPEQAYLRRELRMMQRSLENGAVLEQLFLDFGKRSGIEEIRSFAEVFVILKRSGGDLTGMLKKSRDQLQETIETEKEIALLLASKRYEHRIMCLIPFAMILYLRLANLGFLDGLYGNLEGVLIMTVCLLLYGAALLWGEKLMEITV